MKPTIKYEVGQRFTTTDSPDIHKGVEFIILEIHPLNKNHDGKIYPYFVEASRSENKKTPVGYRTWWKDDDDMTIINQTNKNNMTIKERFALVFKSEPEKTFRKAGITNSEDFLTEDGQKIFLSWLLKLNGDAFKKEVVNELVKEEEDK